MCPASLHLTISVIPTKSEANIDWLFVISFQPIIDIRLSFSYVSDYSFLPILNISPFKIMCISLRRPLCNAFSSSFPKPPLPPSNPLNHQTHRTRGPSVTSGNPRKRVLKCGHISIINYSNESFEWHWLKWLKIGDAFSKLEVLPTFLPRPKIESEIRHVNFLMNIFCHRTLWKIRSSQTF